MTHSFIRRLTMIAALAATLATQAQTTYYVKAPTDLAGDATADGTSWSKAISLAEALGKAKAGDVVYVKGYEHDAYAEGQSYFVPSKDGFVVKSGVKVYGGFKGDETGFSQDDLDRGKNDPRAYIDGQLDRLRYRSVLIGDILRNDTVSSSLTLFPENKLRDDNAYHVVTLQLTPTTDNPNANNAATVLNGFTVTGGNACATADDAVAMGRAYGGGVYVVDNADDNNAGQRGYEVAHCFVAGNYATKGGAIYIDKSVGGGSRNIVRHCSLFNNIAGLRGDDENCGGGIWAEGKAVLVNNLVYCNTNGGMRVSKRVTVVNNTLSRNSCAGIDMTSDTEAGNIYNTVVWGNERYSKQAPPTPYHCAFYNAENEVVSGGEDNVVLDARNVSIRGNAPYFEAPATAPQYDVTFDMKSMAYPVWSYALQPSSALVEVGDATQYVASAYGEKALDGNSHVGASGKIDIGAYAYEEVPVERRRYVSTSGSNDNDGTSWEQAYLDPQVAIDELHAAYAGQRCEVWVARGTYEPTHYIEDDQKKSSSFIMYDGIDVYGGFRGYETQLSQRDGVSRSASREVQNGANRDESYPWLFADDCLTVFQGSGFSTPSWSVQDESWNINTGSYHVVWMAPLPGEAPFTMKTMLNGVTIQGGAVTETTGSGVESYRPDYGSGVYMTANARLQDCVVRYCKAQYGGAVYNQGGQVESCLIYNNVAKEQGGGVFVEGSGQVNRSIIANNKAKNGGGVYLDHGDDADPYALLLALSVVANNTNQINGAVYANGGGVMLQNTIVNNFTSTSSDAATLTSPQTGGVYVNAFGQVINNIIWNNGILQSQTSRSAGAQTQVYVLHADVDKVRFYNNAISSPRYTDWNNVYQSGTLDMATDIDNRFFLLNTRSTSKQYTSFDAINNTIGLQPSWTSIDYYWPTRPGSSLRGAGLPLSLYPIKVTTRPGSDIVGDNFDRPTMGAYLSKAIDIRPAIIKRGDQDVIRVYVDESGSVSDGDGSSWANNHPSLQEALEYFEVKCQAGATLTSFLLENKADYPDVEGEFTIGANALYEICLREGTVYPTYSYNDDDPISVSVRVPKTDLQLRIMGGYPKYATNATPTDADRNAYSHRTELNGHYAVGALTSNASHVVRVMEGSHVVFDGLAITHGNATATAAIQRGGGLLIYDHSTVVLDHCIVENNQAYTGPAIATTTTADNVTLVVSNTVINNNTAAVGSARSSSNEPWVINVEPSNLYLNHVTLANNDGWAPSLSVLKREGNTSLAVGNLYNQSAENCNNTHTLASVGKAGSLHFANPTNAVGAVASGNVYFGGNAEFRPLTSTHATNDIINKADVITKAQQANDNILALIDLDTDIMGNDRDLGGLPDIGAYEALLPKAGSVLYVRSYNTEFPKDNDDKEDEMDGAPDFKLLKENPTGVYNGASWDYAIMGNAICDTTCLGTITADQEKITLDNSIYVTTDEGMLLPATVDNKDYATYLGETTTPARTEPYYGPASGHYGRFLVPDYGENYLKETTTPEGKTAEEWLLYKKQVWDKYYQGNTNQFDWNDKAKGGDGGNYMSINNNRKERYVSGLQLAVELAAKWNALHKGDAGFVAKEVWVGAGVYTDYKGFVIRNGVKVYGGFPKDGTPGENDRKPLLSQYVPAEAADTARVKADYETILQIRKESPVYRTLKAVGNQEADELNISDGQTDNGATNSIALDLIKKCQADGGGLSERHYVLYQPDVCVPTWNVVGNNSSRIESDLYRYIEGRTSNGVSAYWKDCIYGNRPSVYEEFDDVKWDGFTVRHGYTINYMANRDGGAGVRVFRGVELENLIIVNNLTHGLRTRGGGLYMDGDNSVIFNSFILNNLCTDSMAVKTSDWNDGIGSSRACLHGGNPDDYGGGAYMIVGTGYNMVVANNRAAGFKAPEWKDRGGGIFIESAKFYNNTVVYNRTNQYGPGIEQWANADGATGIQSELSLYNCIVYGNRSKNHPGAAQVSTTSAGTFKPAHNCFLVGGVFNESGTFKEAPCSTENGNIVISRNAEAANNPFADGDNARYTNNYRLKTGSICLNGGTDDLNQNGETNHASLPDTDMDYTDRVKDCKVDIGAYEADEYTNIDYELCGTDSIVYYVTETGYGDNSGRNPDNAACAEKLQKVLNHAGEMFQREASKPEGQRVYHHFVVKVAGYDDQGGSTFVYRPNTLADANDPQSYTFVIPDGVTLMGGFYEGTQATATETTAEGVERKVTRLSGYNWYDNNRNTFSEWRLDSITNTQHSYRTILSATAKLSASSSVSEVTGFHTITFGSWPEGNLYEWSQRAVGGGQAVDGKLSHGAVVDGVFIIGGEATENTGHKSMGGGAIVPMGAHVRNCVVSQNTATLGGGVYLMPGAVVSGSFFHSNTADYGGAFYVDNGEDKTQEGKADSRVYAISNTIVRNEAAASGGGVYMENGALMMANSVVWSNYAPIDRNICGVVNRSFADIKLHGITTTGEGESSVQKTAYYPLNDCFVESYSVPADTKNTSMSSEISQYFMSGSSYIPRPYSPLVHTGSLTEGNWARWQAAFGLTDCDMRGTPILYENNTRLTAGAMAVHTALPTELFTRLFVSLNGGQEVSEAEQKKNIGRSFYTPFNSLDLALEYIRSMRVLIPADKKEPLATADTHFEIFMSSGTYKPNFSRTSSSDNLTDDQRLCTFSVPVNTAIYGGFSGKERYACGLDSVTDKSGSKIDLVPQTEGDLEGILILRNASTNSVDRNNNNILEPWELNNVTILSGDPQNVSSKKVYHVAFAEDKTAYADSEIDEKRKSRAIVFDGITIINGETAEFLDKDNTGQDANDEVGHGGALYSNGADIIFNRCRLMDNGGVQGGAVHVKNANLTIIGSYVGNNRAFADIKDPNVASRGGAVHMNFKEDAYGSFYAVNSLFANNEVADGNAVAGQGGAVYAATADDNTQHDVRLVNCVVARNKASEGGGIYWSGKNKLQTADGQEVEGKVLLNTVVWGNQSREQKSTITVQQAEHSASDLFPATDEDKEGSGDFMDVMVNGSTVRTLVNYNVHLGKGNMDLDGPHFTQPASIAGRDGFETQDKWNPNSVSILSDAGSGCVTVKSVTSGDQTTEVNDTEKGGYYDFWQSLSLPATVSQYYKRDNGCLHENDQQLKVSEYMYRKQAQFDTSDGSFDVDKESSWQNYDRYLGGLKDDGKLADKTIDIGLYEYQYKFNFKKYAIIYIGMEEKGDADGRDWNNQSSDLRNAIISMANPDEFIFKNTEGDEELVLSKHRAVYVRGGQYFSPTLLGGNAFSLNMSSSDAYGVSGYIKGACTGEGLAAEAKQDFSNQTVIVPSKLPILRAGNLLDIETRYKPVTIEGLTFMNDYGRGVHVQVSDAKGSLTFRNGGFRENLGSGMYIDKDADNHLGKVLVYNTLFADNQCQHSIKHDQGTASEGNDAGLVPNGSVTVVNATFANNVGYALRSNVEQGGLDGTRVYNSVSWQNKDNKEEAYGDGTFADGSIYAAGGVFQSDITAKTDELPLYYNKAFAYHYDSESDVPTTAKGNGPENGDVANGPNFSEPDKKDYTLRSSFYLQDRGSNQRYLKDALGQEVDDVTTSANTPAMEGMPETERELSNNPRLVGGRVDVGAYELNVRLSPIIYVRDYYSAAGNTGESWDRPIRSLQSAIDLAGLYSQQTGYPSYVFVDQWIREKSISVTADNVHVYGNMDKEKSTLTDLSSPDKVKAIVDDLLGKRKGALERGHNRPWIDHLTMEADAVVDGFEIPGEDTDDKGNMIAVKDGSVTLNKGMLSGSLVSCDVSGTAEGVFYNSLVYDRTVENQYKENQRTALQPSALKVEKVRSVNITSQGVVEDVKAADDATFDFMPSLKGSYANRALNWQGGVAKANFTGASQADTVAHCKYISLQYRDYQLNETDNDNLDRWAGATVDGEGTLTSQASVPYEAAWACSEKAGHSYDVLGNERFRNELDNGCFETWYVKTDGAQITSKDWPRCPSVVYVDRDQELSVQEGALNDKGIYNYLGFLLLKHHAGIRTTNNDFGVMRLAVERDMELKTPQLVTLPFKVVDYNATDQLVAMQYKGEKRAAFSYKFDAGQGFTDEAQGAWEMAQGDRVEGNACYLLQLKGDATAAVTVRFNGEQQGERPTHIFTPEEKKISIRKYNMSSPWGSATDDGVRFTHKENMSWNLVGSPYFCAMNYTDMDYGRVIYAVEGSAEEARFKTVAMYGNDHEVIATGYVPPFDAVLTQTATLDEAEEVTVKQTAHRVADGEAYATATTMAVTVAPVSAPRKMATEDAFVFNAVPKREAKTDFDLSGDGVKWMSVGAPLIYAERGGGRYSRLSAVNEEGRVALGLTLPSPGSYVMGVPEECDREGYDAVMLKDSHTGRSVDLLSGDYAFAVAQGGDVAGRFSITFRKSADNEASAVRVSRVGHGQVRVDHLLDGDEVRVYAADGVQLTQARAHASSLRLPVAQGGMVLVEVVRGGRQVCVKKI